MWSSFKLPVGNLGDSLARVVELEPVVKGRVRDGILDLVAVVEGVARCRAGLRSDIMREGEVGRGLAMAESTVRGKRGEGKESRNQ